MPIAQTVRQSPAPQPAVSWRPRPPLWAQWVISLTIAVVAIVLLVRFVDANSTPAAQAPHISAKGLKVLNQEAEILDSEQQAPRVVRFTPSLAPRVALERAIASYMNGQIDSAQIAGPLVETLCTAVPDKLAVPIAAHIAFQCSALARETGYSFEGVVNRATHTVTYCRHNPPPNPGDNVPVSARCTT